MRGHGFVGPLCDTEVHHAHDVPARKHRLGRDRLRKTHGAERNIARRARYGPADLSRPIQFGVGEAAVLCGARQRQSAEARGQQTKRHEEKHQPREREPDHGLEQQRFMPDGKAIKPPRHPMHKAALPWSGFGAAFVVGNILDFSHDRR